MVPGSRTLVARVAIAMSSCEVRLPEIGDSPNQPRDFSFPSRKFGKSNVVSRAFQPSWFARWKWLHYDATHDLVFCHTCVVAAKTGKMKLSGNMKDSIFLSGGISNWKDATVRFVISTSRQRRTKLLSTWS